MTINSLSVPYIDSLPIPSIEDLSCNHISIKSSCTGNLQIATDPPMADIYIFEESVGDYILQSTKTGSIGFPSTINGIECTSPTRSNRFKLSFPGYVDVEGILIIESGTTYQLDIIMEPVSPAELGGGGLWLPALALGGLILLLFGRKKKKHKKHHEKYGRPEYYEEYEETSE